MLQKQILWFLVEQSGLMCMAGCIQQELQVTMLLKQILSFLVEKVGMKKLKKQGKRIDSLEELLKAQVLVSIEKLPGLERKLGDLILSL